MTRFEWFEKGYGQLALDLGIISSSMFMKFIHYKVYLDYRAENMMHISAIELVAEDFNCSVSNVWKSVSFFVKSEQVEND